ncbi:hypothetical protein K523DRAFT_101047 [Schizophyllum commune Tattone D]|nr:hypothetical protein K523DRAFT_101047 [Schizophyllum commune Tattone D]
MLLLTTPPSSRQIPQDAEMMRLQLLGDPVLMQQLRDVRYTSLHHLPMTIFISFVYVESTRPRERRAARPRALRRAPATDARAPVRRRAQPPARDRAPERGPVRCRGAAQDRGGDPAAGGAREHGARARVFAGELWKGDDALVSVGRG